MCHMRVGVVGAGGMGAVHCRHWSAVPGVSLVVFDVDREKRDALARANGACVAADLEALVDDADIVDVCVPTDHHVKVACLALSKGKATLVEKPLARTLEDAEKMAAAAKASGAQLGVGHVVRYFPEYESIKNAVANGAVGTPAAVRLRRGGGLPRNFDGWFGDQEKSGGVLLDLAVHDFDWILWALGPVTSVYARSVSLGQTVEGAEFRGDYALATLQLASGAVAHVEATWMDPAGGRTTVEVAGSAGLIEYDSRTYPTVRTATSDGTRLEAPNGPGMDPYLRQLQAFHDAVEVGQPAPVGIDDGIAALRVALAAIESAKSNKTVSISA